MTLKIAALLGNRVGRCTVKPGANRGEYIFTKDEYRLRLQLKPEFTSGRVQAEAPLTEGAPHDAIRMEQSTSGEAHDPSAASLRYDLKSQEFTEARVTGHLLHAPDGFFSLGRLLPNSARARGELTLDCIE